MAKWFQKKKPPVKDDPIEGQDREQKLSPKAERTEAHRGQNASKQRVVSNALFWLAVPAGSSFLLGLIVSSEIQQAVPTLSVVLFFYSISLMLCASRCSGLFKSFVRFLSVLCVLGAIFLWKEWVGAAVTALLLVGSAFLLINVISLRRKETSTVAITGETFGEGILRGSAIIPNLDSEEKINPEQLKIVLASIANLPGEEQQDELLKLRKSGVLSYEMYKTLMYASLLR
jgi:hypothetical protein